MKSKWSDAFFEAAAAGRRFDHADSCPGVTRPTMCRCGARDANRALDEMAKGLKKGVPLEGVNLANGVIAFLDHNSTLLSGDKAASKLYQAAKALTSE